MANPSTNDDSKFEVHNNSYDLFFDDIATEDGKARLYTLEMHGTMTQETLNPVLETFNNDIGKLGLEVQPVLYFRAREGASVSNPMANIKVTGDVVNPRSPMGKFVKILGEKKVPILNNASDSRINWLVGAVSSTASRVGIKLNIVDVDDRDVKDVVKKVLSQRKDF